MNRWSTDDFYCSEKYSVWYYNIRYMCFICWSKHVEWFKMKELYVNYGLGGDYEAGSSVVANAPV